MNLFDTLVAEALQNKPDLVGLRPVVEKELLHHEILRVMADHNLTKGLTFIGGTCLRACYGGIRLSEDLDFTGGSDFSRDSLLEMAQAIQNHIQDKYSLRVEVSEPTKEKNNVDTWKIRVETRPKSRHMPTQRINIDICAVNSYQPVPMVLLNLYGVDLGTSGLILQVESREEIFADKLLAFALRPNRIKYRDLWDIAWLHTLGIKPALSLVALKLADHKVARDEFLTALAERVELMKNDPRLKAEFIAEMERFLPAGQELARVKQPGFWEFLTYLLGECRRLLEELQA